MLIPVGNFVNRFKDIYFPYPWPYELGKCGRGGEKKSDCVGGLMYSIEKNGGRKFRVHGSNYAARYEIEGMFRITSASQVKYGMAVFRGKNPDNPGYDLPLRYRVGGADYNGDLFDYSHVGACVRDTSQGGLVIIHSTGPQSKRDTKLGSWMFAGYLKQVDYNSTVVTVKDPEFPNSPIVNEPDLEEEVTMKATVNTNNGGALNVRKSPSTSGAYLGRIDNGAEVDVIEATTDWATINFNNGIAFVMSQFLKFADNSAVDASEEQASISRVKLLLKEALEQMDKLDEKIN